MSLSVALIDKAEAVETVLAHCLHYFNVQIQRFDSLKNFQAQDLKKKPDIFFMDWDFSNEDLPQVFDFIKHIQPVPVIFLQEQEAHLTQLQKALQGIEWYRIKKPLYPAEVRKLFSSLSLIVKETSIYNFLEFPSQEKNQGDIARKNERKNHNEPQKTSSEDKLEGSLIIVKANDVIGAGGGVASAGSGIVGSKGGVTSSGSSVAGAGSGVVGSKGGVASSGSGAVGAGSDIVSSKGGAVGSKGGVASLGGGVASARSLGSPDSRNKLDSTKEKNTTEAEGSKNMVAVSGLKKSDEKLEVSSFGTGLPSVSAKGHQATDKGVVTAGDPVADAGGSVAGAGSDIASSGGGAVGSGSDIASSGGSIVDAGGGVASSGGGAVGSGSDIASSGGGAVGSGGSVVGSGSDIVGSGGGAVGSGGDIANVGSDIADSGDGSTASAELEETKVHNLSGLLSQAAKGLTESADTQSPNPQPKQDKTVFQSSSLKREQERQDDKGALVAPSQGETQNTNKQQTLGSIPSPREGLNNNPLPSSKKISQKPKEEETTVKLNPVNAREESKVHIDKKTVVATNPNQKLSTFHKEQLNIDETTKNDFAPIAMKTPPTNKSNNTKTQMIASSTPKQETFNQESLSGPSAPAGNDFATPAIKATLPQQRGTELETSKEKAFVMSEKDILRTLEKYKDSLEFQNLMEKVLNEQAEQALAGFLQNLKNASFLKRPLEAFQQSQSFKEILKKEVAQYIKTELRYAVKEVAEKEITKVIKAGEDSTDQEAGDEEVTKIIKD